MRAEDWDPLHEQTGTQDEVIRVVIAGWLVFLLSYDRAQRAITQSMVCSFQNFNRLSFLLKQKRRSRKVPPFPSAGFWKNYPKRFNNEINSTVCPSSHNVASPPSLMGCRLHWLLFPFFFFFFSGL